MAKRVCIIGAGPSGLVAAKTLLHDAPRPGSFSVTVYEARSRVGGLWPTRKDDLAADHVHPLMVANQSKHTMQFADFAWEASDPDLPHAWMVGRYLERYAKRYGLYESIKFGHGIYKAELLKDSSWEVTARLESDGSDETAKFDYMLVTAGFFGKPVVENDLKPETLPYEHSLSYRDLSSLLGKQAESGRGGKILVVGGQMSGIEIASTIATQISSLTHSPEPGPITNPEKYTVHHVIQRPIWTFPLFTSPKPGQVAAPFLPLDFPSYNLSNREPPLSNSQGHISEETAKMTHGIYQAVLGTDQGEFHPLLQIQPTDQTEPPYLAVSDHYLDFVRSGLITVSSGKVKARPEANTVVSPSGEEIQDVAAVVFATGYEASSRLSFLSEEVLQTLGHSQSQLDLPLALSFHGTHHPDLPTLGFVGFYRSPYWGVMEMQARFIASLWTPEAIKMPLPTTSIDQILKLRGDPRTAQFPMGDYAWLMQEIAAVLGMTISSPTMPATPPLPHNNKVMDILTPSRYALLAVDAPRRAETVKALEQTQAVAIAGLTTAKFVGRGVFRSLLGTWKLERDITSRSSYQPSGHFSGTARFCLRKGTNDGLKCVTGSEPIPEGPDDLGMEYLYIEEGTFEAENGLRFNATRRYVWRYDDKRDVLSVWFVKPNDNKRVDYLFHELEFAAPPEEDIAGGWKATAGHLCEEDYYGVKYEFRFKAVNLTQWNIEYSVKGPKKDYTLSGVYKR